MPVKKREEEGRAFISSLTYGKTLLACTNHYTCIPAHDSAYISSLDERVGNVNAEETIWLVPTTCSEFLTSDNAAAMSAILQTVGEHAQPGGDMEHSTAAGHMSDSLPPNIRALPGILRAHLTKKAQAAANRQRLRASYKPPSDTTPFWNPSGV